jgi:hypothetical protein
MRHLFSQEFGMVPDENVDAGREVILAHPALEETLRDDWRRLLQVGQELDLSVAEGCRGLTPKPVLENAIQFLARFVRDICGDLGDPGYRESDWKQG